VKNEMRRIFQYDVPGQFRLQCWAMRFQLIDYPCEIVGAESAYENVGALKIGGHIDSINADQCPFEIDLAGNDAA